MARVTTPEFLDLRAIAKRLGLSYTTVRGYHSHAEVNRGRGAAKRKDFPPPDARFGRTPAWRPATIDTWFANRPGRGAGGGRPPRKAPQ